jgi:AcrR family transcriptional regulator
MKTRKPVRRAGRPQADPERDTRAQLVNAATSLFAEHGIAATTFATVAKRAGVTPAMVHYHFPDREQLIDAVVQDRLLPFLAEVWGPVNPTDDPVETIRGVVRRMIALIGREPWVPSTWMREILSENGLLRTRVVRHLPREKVLGLVQAIRAGQMQGRFNPDLHPLLFFFSMIGLVMVHTATNKAFADIFQRPEFSAEEIQQHVTGLLLSGLTGKAVPLETTGDASPRQQRNS